MSTEDVTPGPGPGSSSMSQPTGGHFVNGISQSDGLRNMILSLYNGARNALYGYSTDPAPSTGSSAESIHLSPLPVTDEQVQNNDQAPEDTLGQSPLNHNSTFTSRGDDLEAGGGDDSNGAPPNSNSTSLYMRVLVVGVLLLIVVPGLVLGFVSRQAQWGIALSGAIGTVVGVFAGLYYHHNRRA